MPIRAVLDTNLFVSGALRTEGIPNRILRSWQRGESVLVTTPALTAEVIAVFERPELVARFRITSSELEAFLDALQAAEQVSPRHPLPLNSRNPKDDKILACALGAGADYLVSGDADLLVLAGDPVLGKLQILTPATFLTILTDQT